MPLTIDPVHISAEARSALERAAAGRWPDCADLTAVIAYESQRLPAWRPARAGALVAMHRGAVWMTLDEFEAFIAKHKLRGPERERAIEIAKGRMKSIRAGNPITRVEALACAHYALGLALPVPAWDVEAFGAWVNPRFGAFEAIGDFLGIRGDYITDRIRGYDIIGAKRVERQPGPQLIRALDWVYRVGPSCPYGDAPDVEYWPGHQVQS